MTPKLAIDGGTPVRTTPFHPWPVFGEAEERNLLEVLHSGKWGVLTGSKVTEFEQKFAAYQSARFGVAVPNGTLALHLALRALGVGSGDEVITTPYTFIATASSILLTGATPIFVDIDPASYNLDPAKVEAALSERTRAILPVHLGGRPADMDALLALAQRHNLKLLEDACQAWGSEWRGRRVGALGDLGAFSFQASKNITAGEGGMLVTNDPDLADKCWSIHNVGRLRGGAWYQHEIVGLNLRLPEWEGAVLLAQLERLPHQAAIREENTRYLQQVLRAEIRGLNPLDDDPRVTAQSRHLFILRYTPQAFGGRSRAEFVRAMVAEGMTPVGGGYIPLHQTPAIQRAMNPTDLKRSDLTAAEQAGANTVWIDQTPFLGSRQDLDSIVDAAIKIQKAWV
jgi:dTDP-4-amino-4,6-dideoxygalactose transaminase